MMRLNSPELDFRSTLDECIKGIVGKNDLLIRMTAFKDDIALMGDEYLNAGSLGLLYKLQALKKTKGEDPVVVGTILKSELVKLYDYYFLNEEKPSRATYDKLLNSAREQCPFCGGIGTPRNLDHFLPKAHFPQFSILPQNLVPSCRDCNMDGKAHDFTEEAADQIIQPYIDNNRFFLSQWVFAKCLCDAKGGVNSFKYYVEAPGEWDEVSKKRVKKHFEEFDLEKRYSVKAAQHLGMVSGQILALKDAGISNDRICEVLLEPGVTQVPFLNHWQRGMYQALQNYLC